MTTAPQSPVALTPPLPNRRNAELLLLCFAAVITTVALLIVEINQEQGLSLGSGLGYTAVVSGAVRAARTWRSGASPRTPIRCCFRWWPCSTASAW